MSVENTKFTFVISFYGGNNVADKMRFHFQLPNLGFSRLDVPLTWIKKSDADNLTSIRV